MPAISLGQGLDIRVTSSDAQAVHRALGRIPVEVIDAAFKRALSRAMTKAGVEASKGIRSVYAIKSGRVKEAMKKRQTGPYSAQLTFSSTRPTLGGFSPRQNSQGVSVTVRKGQRSLIRGAFMPGGRLSQNRYGGLPVARGRYAGGQLVPGKSRLPITPLKTISVPVMLKQEDVIEPVMNATQEALRTTLEREINYRLARLA